MQSYKLKLAKTYKQKKRRTVYRSEQEPTWKVPLWTLVQDPHIIDV